MTGVAVANRTAAPTLMLGLGALTALAFALRVVGMDQSLYNDELLTHAIVTENSLWGVFRDVYETSVTPPLHYVLAWFAVQLPGDSTVLVRLPSLIFGTANVPLIFFLGRRIGGDRVGILASVLLALSPFAIYFSNEARTYEVMVFLVSLSTLALLQALDSGGGRWWVVYVVAGCGALWAHYTAVFVLAAEAVWAAWAYRERVRELVVAQAVITAGFLPWLPGFLNQRQNPGVDILNTFATNSLRDVFELPLRTLIGHQFIGLEEVPGKAGLLLIVAVGALAVASVIYGRGRVGTLVPSMRSGGGLVLILALATPVGLLLYDLVGPALYGARNLSASQPGLIVLVALLLTSLASAVPPRVAAPALTCFIGALAVIAVDSIGDENRRPPYRDAAQYLDEVAGGDPVIYLPPVLGADSRLGRSSLDPYFEREHDVYNFSESARAWRQSRAGQKVYLVFSSQKAVAEATGLDEAPPDLLARRARLGGPDGRAVVRGTKTFAGFEPVTVQSFQGAVHGRLERQGVREAISWSLDKHVTVSHRVARGFAQNETKPNAPLTLTGWALDATRPRPVDWVLAFRGGRLVAVSPGGGLRTDVAASHGASAALSGFALVSLDPALETSRTRVFAIVGDRASELRVRKVGRASLQ
jgi:mannosyltransferase